MVPYPLGTQMQCFGPAIFFFFFPGSDPVQNLNADPDPGCQSNADPYGSGSFYTQIFYILNPNISTFSSLFKVHGRGRLYAFIFTKKPGEIQKFVKNQRPIWICNSNTDPDPGVNFLRIHAGPEPKHCPYPS
jgi:hypothetical protein